MTQPPETHTADAPSWQAVCWLAAAADVDVRTARRALELGVEAVRAGRTRERIRRVLQKAEASQ